jgi:hypothetical protein
MSAAFQPHPIPWAEFPLECFYYLSLMALLHLVVFGLGSAIVAVLPSNQQGAKLQRIRRFALYNGLLLIVGSIFNGLWSCLVWDHLYDSTDYFFDFVPFWPITRAVIEAPWGNERGRLLGVSLFELQLVWLVFAAGTWLVTTAVYRLVSTRARLTSVVEATAV